MSTLSRRDLLAGGAAMALAAALPLRANAAFPAEEPLGEVRHDAVRATGDTAVRQRENVTTVLLSLQVDDLLLPIRAMAGRSAPGRSLGGWYAWKPDYDFHHDAIGLAPAATLGQWISAMARLAAADPANREELGARALLLTSLLRRELSPEYFAQTRFPAYTLDKFACAALDTRTLLDDPNAWPALEVAMAAAIPSMAGHAVDREVQWKPGADISWTWEENFTLPENLLRATDAGGGGAAAELGRRYLLDEAYFEPLSRGVNALADKHAYSHVNALCSAAQMHLSSLRAGVPGGSPMHLQAAVNGFRFLEEQSYVTGGWGADEALKKPGYDELYKGLTTSHNHFETPCGSFAHAKLTRALLRVTRDGRYGDSMERVLLNTVAGALPLRTDGGTFYNADLNTIGRRVYSQHAWPCCSGTLPQVVADYGVNSYLHEPGVLWINLYGPSELRWNAAGTPIVVQQHGEYPVSGAAEIAFAMSQPAAFTLKLRIPAWAAGNAALSLNGAVLPMPAADRGFVALNRPWRPGDVVRLHLKPSLRLEALAANGTAHPEVVALLRGPLVLFPLRTPAESAPLIFHGDALLKAEQTGEREWTAISTVGPKQFVPFDAVGGVAYSTYVMLG